MQNHHPKLSFLSSTDKNKKPALLAPYNMQKVVTLPRLRDGGNVSADKQTPVTSGFRVNGYYNSFMRDHFLFEETTTTATSHHKRETVFEITAKLKQRLQSRTRLNQSQAPPSRGGASPIMLSPLNITQQVEQGQSNRLSEMKRFLRAEVPSIPASVTPAPEANAIQLQLPNPFAIKRKNNLQGAAGTSQRNSVTSPRLSDKVLIKNDGGENEQTFYMFEAHDFNNQKRLGEFALSKNENFLERGQLLYDATKVMQMTQFYIRKNLQDIFRKRKFQEQQASQSSIQESESIQAAHAARKKFAGFDPDANLPAYLKDRRHELFNPLKNEHKTTYTEMRCIEKMKAMGKWDYARDGDGYGGTDPFTGEERKLKKIDSLVESVYNSEKNLEWLRDYGQPGKVPPPSEQSDQDFNLYDSSSEKEGTKDDDWLAPPKIILEVTPTKEGGNANNDASELASMHGLSLENTPLDLNLALISDAEARKLDEESDSIEDYFEASTIDGILLASIRHLGPYKVITKSYLQAKKLPAEPSKETLEKIYSHYCTQTLAVPVNFFHLYDTQTGWLRLINFNLQPNMCLALSCVIPFMTALQGVRFRNNGLRDDEAAIILRACQYCPKFMGFLFERNEVGEKFAFILKDSIQHLGERFLELSLSACRNFMKISSKVTAMTQDAYLQHLDLSNTVMNLLACKMLANFIRSTQRLQNLNLSNCALRGTSAREIVNSLLFNQSLKFLNLSMNSLASKDYDLGSKIARMIQIHQALVHLDLTSIQVKREEAMYMGQCLADSSNLVSCHLTGNGIDYYSRLFLRSHLNAIVQYPENGTQQRIGNSDRVQVVQLNNQLQLNIGNANEDGKDLRLLKHHLGGEEYLQDLVPDIAEEDKEAYSQLMKEEDEEIKGRRQLQDSTLLMREEEEGDSPQQNQEEDEDFDTPSLAKLDKKQQSRQQTPIDAQKILPGVAAAQGNHARQQPQAILSGGGTFGAQNTGPSNNGNKLEDYINNGKTRIYDMLQMLDIYGIKRKAEDAKKELIKKFPNSDFAKQEALQETMSQGALSDPIANLFKSGESPSAKDKIASIAGKGTISEQNEMARFVANLSSNFDEKQGMNHNPMHGFLKEIIFTRFIGHEEVDHAHVWRDSSQCWICERWSKAKVQFYEPDALHDKQFQQIFDISQTFRENIDNDMIDSFLNQRPDDDDEGNADSKKSKGEGANVDNGDNEDYFGKEYLIKPPSTFDRNLVDVRNSGVDKVNVKELEKKVLVNAQISTVKMNISRFQQMVVPTIGLLDTDKVDTGLVMHKDCIPYKPFTKKALQTALNTTCKPITEMDLKRAPPPPPPKLNPMQVLAEAMKAAARQRKERKLKKKKESLKQDRPFFMTRLDEEEEDQSIEEWSEVSSNEEEDSKREEKASKARLRHEFRGIFREWWNVLPEIKLNTMGPVIEEIYLVASFNGWLPVRMDAWEKKLLLLKEKDEIEAQSAKIKEQMKHLQLLPQSVLKEHIENKYSQMSRQHNQTTTVVSSSTGDSQKQTQLFRTLDATTSPIEIANFEAEQRVKNDVAYNYSRLIPGGKHYFYFVRQGKFYCLSDRYPIGRFKGTNLYMNELTVKAKDWHISDFDIGEVTGIKSKMKFDVSKSIFRTFKLESDDLLKKMFDLDFKYTKIQKIYKNHAHELEAVKTTLWKNFNQIKSVFLTAIINSEYPVVSWNDFTIICNKCKIPDKVCNLSTIDRIYIATNVNQNVSGAQGDKDLVRYEFLEILVRLANAKYRDTGISNTSVDALLKLLKENIYANMEETHPQVFRDQHLYAEEVNELLVRNEMGLKKLFGLFTHGQKRYMTVKDAIDLVNTKGELRFLDRQVMKMFGMSKMPHMDAINNPEFPSRMVFVEFLEFLGRVAYELFRDFDKMKDEPLHLKYDALLTKLFKLVKFPKSFSFLEANRQNVAYEVVLNPQLASNIEKMASTDRLSFMNDLDSQQQSVKLNL